LIKRDKYKYFLSNKKSRINSEDVIYYLHSKIVKNTIQIRPLNELNYPVEDIIYPLVVGRV